MIGNRFTKREKKKQKTGFINSQEGKNDGLFYSFSLSLFSPYLFQAVLFVHDFHLHYLVWILLSKSSESSILPFSAPAHQKLVLLSPHHPESVNSGV
jgi:hypothetical protein